jgi:pimeloyl-ACP methyl ester carboxylesterase
MTSFRVSDFAADIVDFMDAVGIASAVIVGSSSGGLVSQMVATSHPERVAGLVLISSPASLSDNPGIAAMRDEIMALSEPIDPRFVEQFVRGTSPEGMSEELVVRLVDESLGIPAQVWREAFQGLVEANLPVALETIHVPTLLLSGSEDAFVHDDQRVLLDRIPDAALVVYDGVGHGPHLAHPDLVAADLIAYLNGHQQRSACRTS